MTGTLTLFEFLAAYNSITWVLRVDIGAMLMAICGTTMTPLYSARNSNGLSCSLFNDGKIVLCKP